MDIKLMMKSARSAVIEICDGGTFYTKDAYQILINGAFIKEAETVITSLYDLKPETEYEVSVLHKDGSLLGSVKFTTEYEFVTLNVKDFGAKGDGIQDDTKYIQAAILSCPKNSRVLIPKGIYKDRRNVNDECTCKGCRLADELCGKQQSRYKKRHGPNK
mgnify:CR=1 FL=1